MGECCDLVRSLAFVAKRAEQLGFHGILPFGRSEMCDGAADLLGRQMRAGFELGDQLVHSAVGGK